MRSSAERIAPWWKMVPASGGEHRCAVPAVRFDEEHLRHGHQVLEGAVGQVVQAYHLVRFRCKTTA